MAQLLRHKERVVLYPLLSPQERLLLLKGIQGMWKRRQPDAMQELRKIRREWERKLPSPPLNRHVRA